MNSSQKNHKRCRNRRTRPLTWNTIAVCALGIVVLFVAKPLGFIGIFGLGNGLVPGEEPGQIQEPDPPVAGPQLSLLRRSVRRNCPGWLKGPMN